MRVKRKALDWLVIGAVGALWTFMALWIQPGWKPLLLLGILLCGTGLFGQMLVRWAWNRISLAHAVSGATYGALMAAFAGIEMAHETSSSLRLSLYVVMLVVLVLHVRTIRRPQRT